MAAMLMKCADERQNLWKVVVLNTCMAGNQMAKVREERAEFKVNTLRHFTGTPEAAASLEMNVVVM